MSLFSIAFSLFLLMDPIGNIPFYISFLKGLDSKRQRLVICREMIIALVIIILFSFLGDALMKFLKVTDDTIQIAGGIILFLICLKMIFPPLHDPNEQLPHDTEPFIVPLAVPLVAGPSVLAAVMIYTRQENNDWIMIGAILLAWAASLIILLGSSFLKNLLGWKGIMALERLMGLVLTLIAVQMFLTGISNFMYHQNTAQAAAHPPTWPPKELSINKIKHSETTRQSEINSNRGAPFPLGKGDEGDRFDKVAVSSNTLDYSLTAFKSFTENR